MTITDELVRFIATAEPSEAAAAVAEGTLDDVRQRVRTAGEGTKDAHPAGRPTAMNEAWRMALSAAEAGGWSAIGATVLAMERDSAGSADAIAAMAVGMAVADQMTEALRSSDAAARWSRTTIASLIGAAAAAGRLCRLDDDHLRNLLGICATQAAGLADAEETSSGSVQLAKVAADAIEATVLVRHGFTSSADGLSGRRGLFEVLAPGASWPAGFGAQWGSGDRPVSAGR